MEIPFVYAVMADFNTRLVDHPTRAAEVPALTAAGVIAGDPARSGGKVFERRSGTAGVTCIGVSTSIKLRFSP